MPNGAEALSIGHHAPAGIAPRWFWLGVVLIVEYLALREAFNVAPIVRHAGLGDVFMSIGTLGPIAVGIATAARALGEADLRAKLGSLPPIELRATATLRMLAVHGALLAAFCALTDLLSRTAPADLAHASLWLAAWLVAGSFAGAALVQALLPIGLLGEHAGRIGRHLATGVAVGALAWFAGLITVRLWAPLGTATLYASAALLSLVASPLYIDPTTAELGTEQLIVTISPACSGYEGMGVLLVFLGAYIVYFRNELRLPRALVLLPIGLLVMFATNALRIATLIMIGSHISAEIAVDSFHSGAGWLFLCAVALSLELIARRCRFLWKQAPDAAAAPHAVNPSAVYLVPMLALILVSMVTGLFAAGIDVLEAAGFLAASAALWHYRACFGFTRAAWSWTPVALGLAVFAVWMALEPARQVDVPEVFAAEWAPGVFAFWLVFRVLGSCAVVPIVEELVFRGFLLRRLIAADFTEVSLRQFTWISFLVSSVAFGLLHQRWLAGILAGMVFAFAQYRRGRTEDAIIAHAVANVAIAACVIGLDRWSLWL